MNARRGCREFSAVLFLAVALGACRNERPKEKPSAPPTIDSELTPKVDRPADVAPAPDGAGTDTGADAAPDVVPVDPGDGASAAADPSAPTTPTAPTAPTAPTTPPTPTAPPAPPATGPTRDGGWHYGGGAGASAGVTDTAARPAGTAGPGVSDTATQKRGAATGGASSRAWGGKPPQNAAVRRRPPR
jgi:hypothetical protein